MNQRAGDFADPAIRAEVLQGEELLVDVGNVFAEFEPQLAIDQFFLSRFRHASRPSFCASQANPLIGCLSSKKDIWKRAVEAGRLATNKGGSPHGEKRSLVTPVFGQVACSESLRVHLRTLAHRQHLASSPGRDQ